MQTIGMLGGMSWESSALYYRYVNEAVRQQCGGLHSARCVLASLDFADIESLQQAARWDEATDLLADAATRLEMAGADVLIICTNTMHRLADAIQQRISIPLLHIADATAEAIRARGLHTVGLLGTRFTMEEAFYADRLRYRYGLDVRVPDAPARDTVHRIIYDELCVGIMRDESRAHYRAVMQALVDEGAEGIILGCTEIGMLVSQDDCTAPLFDTTRLHAEAAVAHALSC